MAATALCGVLLLAACGSDGTGPGDVTYENVGGSYAGVMSGTSQGVALVADFSLTLNQNDEDLSGSYALSGTLSDGVQTLDVAGTGVLDGTVGAGSNPSVNVAVTPALCPTRTAQFSGTYDSANRRITLVGPVQFFDGACSVVLTYQMTIILTR
jgi:hypothetical protein